MSVLSSTILLLVAVPVLGYLATAAVLLLNRAPAHDLPLLPWLPSWDPDAYDDIGKRWLPWHVRASASVPIGILAAIFLNRLAR